MKEYAVQTLDWKGEWVFEATGVNKMYAEGLRDYHLEHGHKVRIVEREIGEWKEVAE